jgi:hypothetical protein
MLGRDPMTAPRGIGAPVIDATGVAMVSRPARGVRPATSAAGVPLVVSVFLAVLSAVAGGIHGTLAPDHWREHWLFGVFLGTVAGFQIAWALAILARPSRLLLGAGALVNMGVVLTWVVSRTVGIPVGPGAGMPEAPGFEDGLVTVYELAIAVLAFSCAWRRPLTRSDAPPRRVFPNWEATVGSGALGVVALISASGRAAFDGASAHAGPAAAPAHGLHLALIAGGAIAMIGYGLARRLGRIRGGPGAVRGVRRPEASTAIEPGRGGGRGADRSTYGLTRRRFVRKPPDKLMEQILRPSLWPAWQPEILSAEGPDSLSRGDVVDGRAEMLGFEVTGRSVITAADSVSLDQDVVVGVRMRVRYVVRAAPGGSVLEHRLVADLPRGASGRVLSLFMRPRLRRMQRMILENLSSSS